MQSNLIRLILVGAIATMGIAGAFPAATADHCDPRQPGCQHQEPEKKDHCYWTRTGPNPNPATGGAAPGPQVLTLTCPNHILVKLDYGVKDCRGPLGSPECDPTTAQPIVTDLGEKPIAGTKCGWTHTWTSFAPNFNFFTYYFKAATWKDVDCDKRPDDWNTEVITPNGLNGCYWINYFGPKPQDNLPGHHWPYSAPPYGPLPDGRITYCDLQIYEIQWRAFN